MMSKGAVVLDGKKLADEILAGAVRELDSIKKSGGKIKLATLRATKSKDAIAYETYLTKLLARIGIAHEPVQLSPEAEGVEIITAIHRLNQDPEATGVMVFSPLPKNADPAELFDHIYQSKDVEGRTFLKSHFGVFSPTAHSVLTLVDAAGLELAGKEAVVVGHSDLVGKSTAVLLMDRFATVTVCHKETKDLRHHVQRADILISAAGKAKLIPGDWIKKGAIVIDVGENWHEGRLVGDVDFEKARKRAAFITPVPGGVGPLTNVMLIKNLIRLSQLQNTRKASR